MRELIVRKLRQIEKDHNIRVLLAVESGSRAWGFASPDSDYDVRFIYVRPEKEYLRLEKVRDVIELPINNELDINGWDLQKTLRLLYRSNPTLFEWFSSPIIYVETEFADQFRGIMTDYFSTKRSLYHYISMAEGNYREFLRVKMVKAKKYFYVLRPVLACRWVINRKTQPPMLFSELVSAELPDALRQEVERLLDLKMNLPEVKEIPRIDILNKYLDESITEIKNRIAAMEDSNNNWVKLNDLFLRTIYV
ncbi:MAG: nucleotidyltransferase domain-containing protein [Christensenellaceae bacterium]|nr:nucleotidyltransferase domain-containing protein [Christensenellaceae bacterium]